LKDNKGFSLVELIIVIAIMAILVGILAPQFIKYIEQSREAKDIQAIDSIRKAIEAYSSEHEQRGTHVLVADGNTIEYTLDDGGSLQEYGIEDQTIQSSSDKVVATYTFENSEWTVVDNCTGYYDANGNKK
jgi:type IV pilus assembly protein PilA